MARALVADLFCGAGSLSAGANDALIDLGYAPAFVAVNHWPIAVQTYARNHPGARVHCVTLDAAFPSQLVPEGKLDLLMAGIECTYFSRARGGKPVNDQQRMSAWHVVRWCTELRVKRLLLENVPEFLRWGPVNVQTGRPVKSREGEYFRAWIDALRAIGFRRIEWRVVNCADFGDATTRERLFIMAWQDSRPLPWPEPTHTRRPDLFGSARWRTAREVIDWSLAGRSIFDRKRPLAPKTLARIAAGLVKHGWPAPFLAAVLEYCAARGINLPIQPAAGRDHLDSVQPFVLATGSSGAPRGVDEPLPTITLGGAGHAERPGCARPALIEPFILSQGAGGAPRSAGEPLPTIPGSGAHALVAPYYGSGSGETCRSVDQPLPTATAKARFGLVVPITHSNGFNRARSVDDPLPTLTTANRGELAFITASFGERPTQAPRIHAVDAPVPTICAAGRTNLVTAGREYDILFRMLEPHELAAAMSISEPGRPYHFEGTKTDVIRQIGQAVPRRTGYALARALMAGTAIEMQAAE
ncbi:DNA cytosine methyltransferase [Rhodoplanes serenus]|uniref:DNA cytosine methyltransferase n=1 Tax=Rhodoplanes serenus TaxID=200615 RepID=UPI000DAB8463|nr:DNA cytosine methyltransferase [Rhodoplanes serenus]RAI33728.1 DNA cytosine methyltransferase [Rhodoplanes serenus]